jgi:hypothetical protein
LSHQELSGNHQHTVIRQFFGALCVFASNKTLGIVGACNTHNQPKQFLEPDPHNQTLTTKWVALWLQGWMCDMHHISTAPYFFILRFLISYVTSVSTLPEFFLPYHMQKNHLK